MNVYRLLASVILGLTCVGAVAGASALATSNYPGLPAAKQAVLDLEAPQTPSGVPQPKPSLPPVSLPCVPPVQQAGILNVQDGPLPASQFVASNSWQGPVNGSSTPVQYIVWAGVEGDHGDNPGVPAAVVASQAPTSDGCGFTNVIVGTYTNPQATGPLTITSAGNSVVPGDTILYMTAGGFCWQFDVIT